MLVFWISSSLINSFNSLYVNDFIISIGLSSNLLSYIILSIIISFTASTDSKANISLLINTFFLRLKSASFTSNVSNFSFNFDKNSSYFGVSFIRDINICVLQFNKLTYVVLVIIFSSFNF